MTEESSHAPHLFRDRATRCALAANASAVRRAVTRVAWIVVAAALGSVSLLAHAASPSAPTRSYDVSSDSVVCDRVVDGYSGAGPGAFPTEWGNPEADKMQLARELDLYAVAEVDGRQAIRARYAQEAITIGHETPDWNLDEYPILSWEWKVTALPEGGDETKTGRNDSAAGVYAIWDVGFPFYVEGIKYAWSTTLAPGTRNSKRLGRDQLLVVESGEEHASRWQTVYVNVREHYREFFGKKSAKSPDAIALLTDADATGSRAEAYYANFRLCRKAE